MVSARTPGTRAAAGRSVLAGGVIAHVRQPSTLRLRIGRGLAGGIPARHVVLLSLDVVAAALAVYLAFALRFDDLTPVARLAGFLPVALLPLAVRPLVNRWFDLYSHSWRYVSIPELLRLLIATAAGTAIMVAAFVACALVAHPLVDGFPRSFWFLEGGLSLALMGFLRLAPRIVADVSSAQSPGNRQSRTIMYGAGDAGAMMARGAARQPSAGVLPVAFLDDNPAKWGEDSRGHQGARWSRPASSPLFPVPNDGKEHVRIDTAREIVRDLFARSSTLDGVDRTAYRGFQATAEYADNYRTYSSGKGSKDDARAMAVLDGAAADIKDRALKLLVTANQGVPSGALTGAAIPSQRAQGRTFRLAQQQRRTHPR